MLYVDFQCKETVTCSRKLLEKLRKISIRMSSLRSVTHKTFEIRDHRKIWGKKKQKMCAYRYASRIGCGTGTELIGHRNQGDRHHFKSYFCIYYTYQIGIFLVLSYRAKYTCDESCAVTRPSLRWHERPARGWADGAPACRTARAGTCRDRGARKRRYEEVFAAETAL